ncbi:MAG: hypothetical protein ACNYPH_07040 [Gammaproteobacteria bacterium WSBS_2016_MAG_OTU1]
MRLATKQLLGSDEDSITRNIQSVFYCAGGGIECVAPMLSAFTERRNFVRNGLNDTKGIQCGDIQGAFYAFADASEAIYHFARIY